MTRKTFKNSSVSSVDEHHRAKNMGPRGKDRCATCIVTNEPNHRLDYRFAQHAIRYYSAGVNINFLT